MPWSYTRPLAEEELASRWDPNPAILRSRQNWLRKHVLLNRLRVRNTVRFVEKLDWAVRNGSLAWYKVAMDEKKPRPRMPDLRRVALLREAARRGRESKWWAKSMMMTNSLIRASDRITQQ